MHTITMPQAGPAVKDGTVVRWLKKPGDPVSPGDLLAIIDTENMRVELESAKAGVLAEILCSQGKTVKVGDALATISSSDEKAAAKNAKQEKPAAQPKEAHAVSNATPAGNVTPVLMPKAGQTMEEGTIVSWKVQPGTQINKGDIIFEVETDKSVIEVEAVDAGRLSKIVIGEGDTAAVLTPVAYLADNDADVDAFIASQGGEAPAAEAQPSAPAEAPAIQTPAPAAAPVAASAPTTAEGRIKASPAARRVAREKGVDLATVGQGRGPGGRILSQDVLSAPAATAPAARPAPAPQPVVEGEVVRRPMSAMRKAIARNLLASKQNIPHFYMRATIDADPLMSFYQGEKAKYRCSLNDVVVMACAKAIQEFPAFRSRLDGDALMEFPTANIGIAVGLDNGLVVPVVVAADQMKLKDLALETRRLAEQARGGKIENMGKGVFTISNLGMFGVEEFSAIINPPEAAILAVAAVREEVIVSGGTLRPGRVMTMTLSCDHRVIDGLLAAKFMARLKEILEWPAQLA
ncbi:MAG: biotin/lipoyl-binding protein [Phycisphaerae bacterium]|nr:biotin/lipoyl-binding protein [Phycisphaerae bacterium]